MCVSGCGMLYKEGKPLKEITCPCGSGYWDIFRERFVSGDQIREGEPSRSEYEEKVKTKLKADEFEARLREQWINHFLSCPTKLALDEKAIREGTCDTSTRRKAKAELSEIARGDFTSRGRSLSIHEGESPTAGYDPGTASDQFFLPSDGIRQDVLEYYRQSNVFGAGANVQPYTNPDGMQGYLIRSTTKPPMELISELQKDSVMVEEAMRQKAEIDQRVSVGVA